jgi:hypothetical protein
MKISRIIWPVLLIVTGFTCLFSWLTIQQQASQARILIPGTISEPILKPGHVVLCDGNTSVNSIPVTDLPWLNFTR